MGWVAHVKGNMLVRRMDRELGGRKGWVGK